MVKEVTSQEVKSKGGTVDTVAEVMDTNTETVVDDRSPNPLARGLMKIRVRSGEASKLGVLLWIVGCCLVGVGAYWYTLVGAVLVLCGVLLVNSSLQMAEYEEHRSLLVLLLSMFGEYVNLMIPIAVGIGLYRYPQLSTKLGLTFLLLGFMLVILRTLSIRPGPRIAGAGVSTPVRVIEDDDQAPALKVVATWTTYESVVLVALAAVGALSIYLIIYTVIVACGLLASMMETLDEATVDGSRDRNGVDPDYENMRADIGNGEDNDTGGHVARHSSQKSSTHEVKANTGKLGTETVQPEQVVIKSVSESNTRVRSRKPPVKRETGDL